MNIAIIGAGPAGVAAAIQLKRYGFDPMVFERNMIGGLIKNAWKVENYPGFPDGISGMELVSLLEKHIRRWNIDVIFEEVKKLDFQEKFLVKTDKDRYGFDVVVVASGTKPKQPDLLDKLDRDAKNRTFYEVYPLLNLKDEKVAVMGSGDAAFDYAMSLSEKGNKVYLLSSRNKEKALPLLVDAVKNNERIVYLKGVDIDRVGSIDKGISISYKEGDQIEVGYLLIAVGRRENKDFYSENLRRSEKRLISKGILYLAGDVKNGIYRQISIAVGDGIKTAMEIYHRFGGSR